MTAIRKIFPVLLIVFLTFAVSSCSPARIVDTMPSVADGEVLAVYGRTAIWGIEQALQGAGGSGILQYKNSDLYAFWWKGSGGMYSVFVDFKNQQIIRSIADIAKVGGNFTNSKTFQEFAHTLEQNGWKAIPASAVPQAFKSLFSLGTSWVMTMSQSLVSVFVVPATALEPSVLKTTYPVIDQ